MALRTSPRTFSLSSCFALSLTVLGACGDDSSTTTEGGGTGGGSSSASVASSGSLAATTTAAQSSTSTGHGTGGEGAGGEGSGGDPTGTGGDGAGGAPSGSGGAGGGAGGESSGSGVAVCDDVVPPEPRVAACNSYAGALCGFYADCQLPSFLYLGGDPETCAARFAAECVAQKNVDEDEITVCLGDLAAQYVAAACGGPIGFDYPASCLRVGNLADGEPCFEDFECHNGLCAFESSGCGACVPLRGEGASCTEDETCELPLSCIEGECAAAGIDGTPCDSARDCAGLACVEDVCATVEVAGLGDDCGDLAECDSSQELRCDAKSGTCVANPTPAPGVLGEDCVEHQVDYGGTLLTTRLCEPGTVCSQGTCVEAGLPGEACPVEGACYGSLCEDDVCVVLDPNTCACD